MQVGEVTPAIPLYLLFAAAGPAALTASSFSRCALHVNECKRSAGGQVKQGLKDVL
jgi:hypothetical protein